MSQQNDQSVRHDQSVSNPDSKGQPLQPSPAEQAEHLARLAVQVMPVGKYAGTYLTDLPEAYLFWFERKGWPRGQLGQDLQEMLEINSKGV